MTSWEDWYGVETRFFMDIGVGSVLSSYGNSHIRALASIFPEHDWKPWNFRKIPRDFWSKEENIVQLIEWMRLRLGVRDMDDWYLLICFGVVCTNGIKLPSPFMSRDFVTYDF